jgi:hypothetical protein
MLHVYTLDYQGPLQSETVMVYVLLSVGTVVLNLELVGQDALDLSLYCDICSSPVFFRSVSSLSVVLNSQSFSLLQLRFWNLKLF